MQFVIERAGIDDDLLVIAGDNLFEFDLSEFVRYWRSKGIASAIAVRDVGTRELAQRYGIVDLGDDGRVLDFVEKPERPAVDAGRDRDVPLPPCARAARAPYLDDGNPPDQPGRLVGWLYQREPVYGWAFDAGWYDIGDHEQLLEADNRLRREQGLPERATYSPD